MSFILKDVMKEITSEITAAVQHKRNLLLRLRYYEKTLEEVATQAIHIEKEMEKLSSHATRLSSTEDPFGKFLSISKRNF